MLGSGHLGGRGRRIGKYVFLSILLLIVGPSLLGGAGSWLAARFSDLVAGSSDDPSRDELQTCVAELMIENAQLREQVMKAERYRLLLGITRTSRRTALAGRVLYRTEGLVEGSLVIDRGTRDGVTQGAVCLTSGGLVGIVSSVSDRTCEVLPLTSPSIRVSCATYPSGAVGILEPSQGGQLRLVNVDLGSDVQTGDQVVTSRFGGVYPDGLLVGTVVSHGSGRPGLELELTVEPAVDFGRISEVLILLEETS
jgi:rod shape-determining protein MreC